MRQNFHIGIMGNLFSGKTTLMHALARDPYKKDFETLLGGAELFTFSERVDKGSLIDECLALFYHDRVANIFATELAFLNMRTMQQREIRHLMTRESSRGVDHHRGPAVHRRPRGVRHAHDRLGRDAARARQALPDALPPDAAQRAHPPART